MLAEGAVLLSHGAEEAAELTEEFFDGEALVADEEAAEEVVGQESDRVREEAEEEAHEEVGDLLLGCAEVALFEFEAFGLAGE